ncbi:MAG: hypothetical protein DI536_27370 [Archangium gephyra]|uniref:OmpH family outer membrane protein n=1 Tax=Archangium gephyra TaxID=48 RepID=A0A2W5T402_9BACT|nr:MAG: hypothetical protein DI536_27370 [Archangium gephyra]
MRRLTILLTLLTATAALAELKLGYVDLQRALSEVGEGISAKNKLKSEIDAKKAEVDREQKKLREDSMVLDRQSAAMSEEVRVQKMKELQQRLLQMSEKGQKLQVEFVEKERIELKKIFDKMDPIVASIAQREGLSVVLEKTDSGLVYALPSMDITNELVRTYNEKYPVKGIKLPASKEAPKDAPKDAPTK